MLNPYFKKVLKRSGFYNRLKSSYLHDLYCLLADARQIDGRSAEVNFYRNLLEGFQPGNLVFDVGANAGQKTDVFLRLGARVVAVEPDELGRQVLREKFLRYRFTPKPVVITDKAISDRQGVQTMWIDGPGSALNTLSEKWAESLKNEKLRFDHSSDSMCFRERKNIETTTLEQLMTTHGRPFFVKIDVEGFELEAIRGLKRRVPYLSFEVNLPEFRKEGLQCIDLLQRLASDGSFNYTANCQRGLASNRWLTPPEVSLALDECTDKSIEIFWKTPLHHLT